MGQEIRLRLGGSLTVAKCIISSEYRSLIPPQDGAAAFTRLSDAAIRTVNFPPIECP